MMSLSSQHEPTVIMIFGASGDLTQRKVVPALYDYEKISRIAFVKKVKDRTWESRSVEDDIEFLLFLTFLE